MTPSFKRSFFTTLAAMKSFTWVIGRHPKVAGSDPVLRHAMNLAPAETM